MSSPDRPVPSADPAARPRTLAQRLQLLAVLLVIPGLAVTLPTLVVTHFFGQGPRRAAPASDVSGLTEALKHSAVNLLPTPAPLTVEPIRLSVRADHLAARAEKVGNQAKTLGGTAVEGISANGEKHLFVDLPAGCAEAFRRAVTANETPQVPVSTPTLGAARDQLEVVIRPAADDE